MAKKRLLSCLIAILPLLSFSQEFDYRFKNFSSSDGLSQSAVIAIEQDRLGKMWFGTRDGLNSYDGHTFKTYRNISNDSTTISNNDILSIHEDRDGFIWVGTYDGLNKYDPVNANFVRYRHNNQNNSLVNNTIWKIVQASDGKVWIATSNGVSVNNGDENFTNLLYSSENANSLPSNRVLDIAEGADNRIWLGTSLGLCYVFLKDNDFSVQRIPYTIEGEPLYIQDLLVIDNDTLYIATKNHGLLRYTISTGSFSRLFAHHLKNEKDIRTLTIGHSGDFWIGTASGIYVVEPNDEAVHLQKDSRKEGALKSDFIKELFKDNNGSIWVGTYLGGVSFWDSSNINFIKYNEGNGPNSLGSDVVSSIEGGVNNKLYIGTEGGGVTVLDLKFEKSKIIDSKNYPKLRSDNIKSLSIEDNELWIGSFNKGLFIFDLSTDRFKTNSIPEKLQSTLKNTGIYSIKRAGDNIFWIGTFGEGLVRYDNLHKKFDFFKHNIDSVNSLTNNRVRCLMVDNLHRVWAGTQNGLNLLSDSGVGSNNFVIERFFYDQVALSGYDIQTIFQDSSDNIWVGTREKGLFKYNGKTFLNIRLNHSLPIHSVYAILEEAPNLLWISTNKGLVRYDIQNGNVRIFDKVDGIASNEFNSGAAYKTEEGGYYFGGPSGISAFSPSEIKENQYAPKVILTELQVKNKTIKPNDGSEILSESVAYANTISLGYDKANFSISFAMPNFISPEKNKYKYRLLGLENEWNITSDQKAFYTIQNPGEYIFEVAGANNDGVWNQEVTQLNIEILPAPWRSPLAFFIYGLAILMALLGLGWIVRSKTRLRHQLELESLRHNQMKEIHNAKLKFFTNISHEFRTPLTLILGPLQQLLENYKGSREMYNMLLVIESNAKHLLQLINRLMDFRKLENKQFQLKAAEGNIVKFLREIYLSFTEYAKCEGLDYDFSTSDPEIKVFYDRPKLEQVFYNLLSNAFRYTEKGGKVWMAICKTNDDVIIEIGDTGAGIPREHQAFIFDRFFEIPKTDKESMHHKQGTGIGLAIAKNIVELHKGTIEVKSKEREGSTFRVFIPLGGKHLSEEEILKNFKFSDDLSLYKSQLPEGHQTFEPKLSILEHNPDKNTVMIVEDDHPLRSFLSELLREEYNILEASNGNFAFEEALKHVPDLIVSDVIMPGMVGTELCAKIKSNLKTSHIPFILLTSRTSLIYKFEGLESGADDYISKPFDIREFKLRIHNLLESSKKLREKFSNADTLRPKDITVSSADEKLLKKALTIVNENISNENFDIHMFASELGVSRTLLFTKIKAWTNRTPNDFIQEIRLKRAAFLLEEGKLNVAQVGYAVGFKNPKYFSKCFRKHFGQRPSDYSKKFFA